MNKLTVFHEKIIEKQITKIFNIKKNKTLIVSYSSNGKNVDVHFYLLLLIIIILIK
jgi:hypothetical protein